jgi:hypothetical protein
MCVWPSKLPVFGSKVSQFKILVISCIDWPRAGLHVFQSQKGHILLSSPCLDHFWGPLTLIVNGYVRGALKLTAGLHLFQRLRMRGAILVLSPTSSLRGITSPPPATRCNMSLHYRQCAWQHLYAMRCFNFAFEICVKSEHFRANTAISVVCFESVIKASLKTCVILPPPPFLLRKRPQTLSIKWLKQAGVFKQVT